MISWPGRVQAQRSRALVELVDLPQTLLDAAGLPHHPGMMGKSLWQLLMGKADAQHYRDDVYCEYDNAMNVHQNPNAHLTMTRTDRFKIVVDHSGNTGELYDFQHDPNETHNRWDAPAYLTVKTEMLTRLTHRMAWTVDPRPPRRAVW